MWLEKNVYLDPVPIWFFWAKGHDIEPSGINQRYIDTNGQDNPRLLRPGMGKDSRHSDLFSPLTGNLSGSLAHAIIDELML